MLILLLAKLFYYLLYNTKYYILKDFPNLRKDLDLDNILVHDLKFELLD